MKFLATPLKTGRVLNRASCWGWRGRSVRCSVASLLLQLAAGGGDDAGEHAVHRDGQPRHQSQRGRMAQGRVGDGPGADDEVSTQVGEGRAVRSTDDVASRGMYRRPRCSTVLARWCHCLLEGRGKRSRSSEIGAIISIVH